MKTKDGRHTFKWLTYKGRKVRIDEEIAPLISKMWKLGIGTQCCCQEYCNFNCNHKYVTRTDKKTKEKYTAVVPTKHCHNNVWIYFESSSDVERLYDIVAEYDPKHSDGSMYDKMSCDSVLRTEKSKFNPLKEGWSFIFVMTNLGVDGHFGRPIFDGKRSTCEMWIEDGCKKNNFYIQPQLTFPRKHISYLEERLDLAIKKMTRKKKK